MIDFGKNNKGNLPKKIAEKKPSDAWEITVEFEHTEDAEDRLLRIFELLLSEEKGFGLDK